MTELVYLFFLTISVYGVSWILTKSYLFRGIRNYFAKKELTYLSKLFNCIVCMSVWVSIFFLMLLDSNSLRIYHYFMTAGYAAGSTWIIASLIGDAS